MRKIRETPTPLYSAISNEPFPPPGAMSDGTIIVHVDTSEMWVAKSSADPFSSKAPLGGWLFLENPHLNLEMPLEAIGLYQTDTGIQAKPSDIQQATYQVLTLILQELKVLNLLSHAGLSSFPISDDLDTLRVNVFQEIQ